MVWMNSVCPCSVLAHQYLILSPFKLFTEDTGKAAF